MKRQLSVSIAVFLVLVSAAVCFATNGDNMTGVSPVSRGMGGIGVGMPVGAADSIFRNPAWMNAYGGTNFTFGSILFMPHVKARSTIMGDTGYVSSDADLFVVPEIGITHQVSDAMTLGIGAFGVSGMGTDYRNKANGGLMNMHTTFQFMRIIPALSYKINNSLSLAAGLHVAWGSLDMGATMPANAGGGQSQSFGAGGQLGVAYNVSNSIFLGATYQSPVTMKYKKVFDTNGDPSFEDLKLSQPQEASFGIGYKPSDGIKFGADLRWIDWSHADGYKAFQWKDQWVVGVGGEFKATPSLALRAGWNYGKTPIREGSNLSMTNANTIPNFANPFPDGYVAMFNLLGFPAITEHHITVGLGYEITKHVSIDLAYERALEKKVESTLAGGAIVGAKNAQDALTMGLNWKF